MAVPAVKTMIKVKKSSIMINGNIQNFLRTFKNCHNIFYKFHVDELFS